MKFDDTISIFNFLLESFQELLTNIHDEKMSVMFRFEEDSLPKVIVEIDKTGACEIRLYGANTLTMTTSRTIIFDSFSEQIEAAKNLTHDIQFLLKHYMEVFGEND